SAQQRALCDNELLHFQMENVQHAVLRSSLPFSTPLRPTRPTIYLSARRCHATPSYQMIGTGQREEEPLGVEAVENPPQRWYYYQLRAR
ncbi:hypothetical protein KUCAC02_006774, partial [Chaenocephalus aceratus]